MKPKISVWNRLKRAVLWVFTAAILVLVLYHLSIAARLWWWRDHAPASTAFMDAHLDAVRAKNPAATLKHQWVEYEKISDHLKRAVIASEDAKFTDHEGFDWEGIQKAREKNKQKGKVVAGGSTISQQLAKNLFLSGQRSIFRKGEEAVITVMMENILSKERIFEIYLNMIEWGESVYGAEAAARHYYNQSAAKLSAPQAAKLAAMVPRPKFYDKNRNAPWLLKKTDIILSRMADSDLP
jgi:monofunctional glycosyltransferase